MLKLLNQKSDQNLETEKKRLEALIQRHTEVLPGIEENMRKVSHLSAGTSQHSLTPHSTA